MKFFKWYITRVNYKKKLEMEKEFAARELRIYKIRTFNLYERLTRIRDLCGLDNYGDVRIPDRIREIIDAL